MTKHFVITPAERPRHYRLEGHIPVPCSMMDWAAQILGPSHRVVAHDPASVAVLSLFNALTQASNPATNGGNFWTAYAESFLKNFGAGLLHIAQDESFSSLKRMAGNATQYDRPLDTIRREMQKVQQQLQGATKPPALPPPKPARKRSK